MSISCEWNPFPLWDLRGWGVHLVGFWLCGLSCSGTGIMMWLCFWRQGSTLTVDRLINAFSYWQGQTIANATANFFDDMMQAIGTIQVAAGSTTAGPEIWVGETGTSISFSFPSHAIYFLFLPLTSLPKSKRTLKQNNTLTSSSHARLANSRLHVRVRHP